MNFLNIGYYIVEPMPTPEYLDLRCKQIITVTECICNVHPSLIGCYWLNQEKRQSEYKKLLGLSDETFTELKETVMHLYEEHKLDVDSRFNELPNALLFCKKYLSNQPNMRVISIALEDTYKDVFIEDAGENLNVAILCEQKNDGKLLGYDILGWDWSSFHSYLCNGLNKDISDKYPLEINEFGLIQNPYSQVKEFAKCINGMGEPVLWLPFAVYSHEV